MAGAVRIIKRLRLRASSEAAVRRSVLALEDAFRTATLPDVGPRLIVVRRMDLGPLPREASAQQMSLLVESRITAAHGSAVHGGDEGANVANAVWFQDALEAHLLAAHRVAAGQSAAAWFWPRAVPGLAQAMAPLEMLRTIAFSVAACEEAPAALPAWTTSLVRAGFRQQLTAALRPGDGMALQRAAGGTATARSRGRNGPRAATDAHDNPVPPSSDDCSAFIDEMICRAPRHPWTRAAPARSRAESTDSDRNAWRLQHIAMAADSFPAHDVFSAAEVATSAPVVRISAGPTAEGNSLMPIRAPDATATSPFVPVDVHGRQARQAIETCAQTRRRSTSDGMHATRAGGVFFLVPVLERLGVAEWCAQADLDPVVAAGQILRLALGRLRIEDDDPAWLFAMGDDVATDIDVETLRTRLAVRLEQLAPGRGAGSRSEDPARAAVCRDAGARRRFERMASMPGLWLASARRLLRRRVGIGLATVIRRPARMALTATHVDLFFPHDAGDTRVRRAGLDIDPGWVPWLARVVTFHYEDRSWR